MADCNFGDVICGAGNLVSGAVGSAVDSGAQNLGQAMMGAWDSIMKSFLTSWLGAGMLVPLDGSSVSWLTDQLQVISVFLAVVGIMIACIWTMIHYRGDKAIKVAQSLFTVFLVTTIGTAVVQLGITATDSFSTYVLDQAGVSVNTSGSLGVAGVAVTAIGPGLAIIAGIFGVVATLFQWIIMGLRAVILPLLVAVWPVSAAGAMVNGGEEMFSKISKWILAFMLYKPIAAVIYAFAWKLKSGGDGIGGVINGMLLLVLAVVALPAIMKLIGPSTNALGRAAGGAMAMTAGAALLTTGVAAGAAVATGGASAGASAGAAGTAGTAGKAGTAGASSTAGTAGGGEAATAGGGEAATAGGGGGGEALSPGSGGGKASGGGVGGTFSGGDGPSSGGEATGSTQQQPATTSGGGGSAQGSATTAGGSAPSGGGSQGSSQGSSKGGQVAKAAAEALGRAVAEGAKNFDGKDVFGE